MKNDITVNMQNLSKNERALLMSLIKKANNPISFDVNVGDTFKIADIEFIRFPKIDGGVPIATKDILFNAKFDNNTNNFAKSKLLKRLKSEILPKIEEAVGADNVLEFETDLLTLNGMDEYGKMKSKISLPNFDFYRQNYKTFAKYNPKDWWWLSTADSTNSSVVCCVDSSGTVSCNFCDSGNGVRPFLILKSSIFTS